MVIPKKHSVLIVAEGDSWAGIESHLSDLIPHILQDERFDFYFLLFSEGVFSRWLKSRNIRVLLIKEKGFLNKILRVWRYLQKNEFEIIHTHSSVAMYFAVYFFFHRKKSVWINTQHSKPEPCGLIKGIKGRIAGALIYSGLRNIQGTRTIAVSKDLADWLTKHRHIPKEKIQIIRNGISLPIISRRPATNLRTLVGCSPEDFVISIIGRLVPVKGHQYLLDALQLINTAQQQTAIKCKLLVVGEGPLLNYLKEQCIIKGLERQVFFLGYRRDARDLIAISDAIAIPSTHEGIPYTLLEAMALKKPIIATNVGGLHEVLTHNKDALLVAPNSSEELFNGLVRLGKNKKLSTRLAANAEKTVRHKYSAKRMSEQTLDQYIRMA